MRISIGIQTEIITTGERPDLKFSVLSAAQ